MRNVFDKGANETLQRGSKIFLYVFKEFCAFRIKPGEIIEEMDSMLQCLKLPLSLAFDLGEDFPDIPLLLLNHALY